ncbi:MAG: T9SS type A sorting domain-containing protein [Candidatus Cloacimonadota bacterium]|nr:MAG: T9SS type A sorting domain-containing protein [Candidatus Cloacimonadota bacterium]
MKSRDVKNLIFLIFVLLPLFVFADSWIQTDWSGGDGYPQWQDPTGYFEGIGVNGWREPGSLTLFAPDFEHFYSLDSMPGAQTVSSLFSDNQERYYAGCGWNQARLFISSNFGNTWDSVTTTNFGGDEEIDAILLSSLNTLFVGTGMSPGRIWYKETGDTTWSSKNLTGTNTTSIIETIDQDLYASTAGNGVVYRSTNYGLGWSQTPGQPKIGNYTTTAIYQLFQAENEFLYAVTKCSDGNGWVFFSDDLAAHWDTCHSLPTTVKALYSISEGPGSILFIGTGDTDGDVFKSTDQGYSWEICEDLQDAQIVNGIIVDKDTSVFAVAKVCDIEKKGFIASVFHSTDKGQSWVSVKLDSTYAPTSFWQTKKGFLLVGTEKKAEIFKSAYVDSGYLVSSVYDVGTGNGSSNFDSIITWSENLNGQNLAIKVRTDTVDSMAGALFWDLCPLATNGEPLSNLISVDNGHRYIQYRVELSTGSIDYSSELIEIEIRYSIDTIPPHIDTAYASDGSTPGYGIDADDYVILIFDDTTNEPPIPNTEIDTILVLSSGHSWCDINGDVLRHWLSPETLKIYWSPLNGLPTVEVGDTIYPDSFTITDIPWGNPCFSPIVLTGSFDPPGIAEGDLPSKSIERVTVFPSISRAKVNIKLNIKNDSDVKINIFDISGRLVNRIVERKYSKGVYTINWYNKENSSGIYFIKTDINNKSHIDKVTIVK